MCARSLCVVEFEAIPQDIAVLLSGITRPQTLTCTCSAAVTCAVYRDTNLGLLYRNCREQLDWGAQLDIDDVNGYGPENITVDQPNRFDYLVGAHTSRRG